ncbi:MAG: hypothetical protein ACI9MR_000377 [Myxococcota bacterium]|jgi:hypothetical protein
MADTEFPRHDILIVPVTRTFNLVQQGMKSVINHLATAGIMTPTDEAVAKEWVEVYGKAGPTAHVGFTKGAFPGTTAPFLECLVHTSQTYDPVPYGSSEDDAVRFYIEFRGCLWPDVAGKFRNQMARVLATRIEVFTRPFSGTLPEHREVPEDEIPDAVKFARTDRATSRVGTAVEEF